MGYSYRTMNVKIRKENLKKAEDLLRAGGEGKKALQGVDFLIDATSTRLCTSHIDENGDLVVQELVGEEAHDNDNYWAILLAPVIENNSFVEVESSYNDTTYRDVFYGGGHYERVAPVWPTGEQLSNPSSKLLFTYNYTIDNRLHIALVMAETKEAALEKAKDHQKTHEEVMLFTFHDHPTLKDLEGVSLSALEDDVIVIFQEHR